MSEGPEVRVLLEAEFNPNVKTYWLLTGTWILVISVVGIVLIPFWLILGNLFVNRYLKRLRCAMTERSVLLNKGILVRTEKTVPLDKITDVGLVQGPVMRLLNLQAITFETAGQATGGLGTLSVVGISEGRKFRDAVLKRRDEVTEWSGHQAGGPAAASPSSSNVDATETLSQILNVLQRIEQKLQR